MGRGKGDTGHSDSRDQPESQPESRKPFDMLKLLCCRPGETNEDSQQDEQVERHQDDRSNSEDRAEIAKKKPDVKSEKGKRFWKFSANDRKKWSKKWILAKTRTIWTCCTRPQTSDDNVIVFPSNGGGESLGSREAGSSGENSFFIAQSSSPRVSSGSSDNVSFYDTYASPSQIVPDSPSRSSEETEKIKKNDLDTVESASKQLLDESKENSDVILVKSQADASSQIVLDSPHDPLDAVKIDQYIEGVIQELEKIIQESGIEVQELQREIQSSEKGKEKVQEHHLTIPHEVKRRFQQSDNVGTASSSRSSEVEVLNSKETEKHLYDGLDANGSASKQLVDEPNKNSNGGILAESQDDASFQIGSDSLNRDSEVEELSHEKMKEIIWNDLDTMEQAQKGCLKGVSSQRLEVEKNRHPDERLQEELRWYLLWREMLPGITEVAEWLQTAWKEKGCDERVALETITNGLKVVCQESQKLLKNPLTSMILKEEVQEICNTVLKETDKKINFIIENENLRSAIILTQEISMIRNAIIGKIEQKAKIEKGMNKIVEEIKKLAKEMEESAKIGRAGEEQKIMVKLICNIVRRPLLIMKIPNIVSNIAFDLKDDIYAILEKE